MKHQRLEEGDIVLCTVDRIERTVVFVRISLDGQEIEGNIVLSEIAPGRIRNLREYVVPKKKIICKVLRIKENSIELSLRRVSLKEQKEKLEEIKKEKSYENILKTTLGKDFEKASNKIKEISSLYNFLEEAKENSKELEKIVGKDNTKKIMDIFGSQKEKSSKIRREISLKFLNPNGLDLIKESLKSKDLEIKYISAGKYSIESEDKDLKSADNKIKRFLEEVEKFAKKNNTELIIK